MAHVACAGWAPSRVAQAGPTPSPAQAPPIASARLAAGCSREWRRWRRQRRQSAAAAASPKLEGPLLGLAELLGYTGDDPGHWNFSPEWYGTQGGGWGRDAGVEVFAAESQHGNGTVTVTAHPAVGQPSSSARSGPSSSQGGSWEEWRVLRFNGATRQTVMRCTVAPSSSGGSASVAAQPDCLAQEYLKTGAAVAAALLGLQRLLSAQQGQQQPRVRALCIGVGGGSLPLFLAHHFPCMDIDAVELDPAVLTAATSAMGLPADRPNLRLHCADAAAFLAACLKEQQGQEQEQQQQQGQQQDAGLYDLVFMDAFDGEDNVPAPLCSPEFAARVAAALHPRHGCFLLNLHSLEGPGRSTVAAFKAALLGNGIHSSSGSSSGGGGGGEAGACFAVAAQRQRNVCVAVARGLPLPAADYAACRRYLFFEAQRVAEAAGYRFPAGGRACRDFAPL